MPKPILITPDELATFSYRPWRGVRSHRTDVLAVQMVCKRTGATAAEARAALLAALAAAIALDRQQMAEIPTGRTRRRNHDALLDAKNDEGDEGPLPYQMAEEELF